MLDNILARDDRASVIDAGEVISRASNEALTTTVRIPAERERPFRSIVNTDSDRC